MLESIKNTFEETFEIPFQVSCVNDGKGTSVRVGPEDQNKELFSLVFTFPDRVRMNAKFEPHTFSKQFIKDFSTASQDGVQSFYSFLSLLQGEKVPVDLSVNGNKISFESSNSFWPSEITQFLFSITKAPIEGTTEENREKLIIHYGSIMMGAILSLAHYKELDKNEAEKIPVPSADSQQPELEGNKYSVVQNKYERSAINRLLCLEAKGYRCAVCGMSFEENYGEIGKNYIQVHHIVPVSQLGPNYHIDPEKDLVPVCANCHAMLHRKNPPYTPDELKAIVQKNKK